MSDELELPPGIPASIPFERMQELVRALGLPLEDLLGFRVYSHSIEAEFYAKDKDGHRYIRGDGEVAIHTVNIKVDRDGPDPMFRRQPETLDLDQP